MRALRLDQLVADLDEAGLEVIEHGSGGGLEHVTITSVTHDSRLVTPGALFCCLPGRRTDGRRHAAEAVARGAVALLAERVVDASAPLILVADARRATARAAASFWGHPSERLQVVGVTGTNGKTTTTWLLRSILEAAGRPTGLVGTLGGTMTTPEATELQATLATMSDAGTVAVAMEVSSHALAQSRVEATSFTLAVFTNLSRDHLDFHASMEEYFSVKARLFDPELTAGAVVNVDDPHGRLLLETAQVPTHAFSPRSDVTDVDIGWQRCTGTWRGRRLVVPLGGTTNLANGLAAATAALSLGVDEGDVIEGLAAAPPVPGRYEHVEAGQPFDVVVDYAHTPDALEQLLVAARGRGGRVLVVFGCGGERDRDKRGLMGRVAATLADMVIVTSDNPRAEDPADIAAEVVGGAEGPGTVEVELDRRAAIHLALSRAGPGDVVLVAGKGHEATQMIGRRVRPFSDRSVVVEELAALGLGTAS